MATFADPVIMLFIGGFVLAIAATKTGLDAQLAKVLLKPFGTRSEMVLLGFLLITGLFSMFVSNTASWASSPWSSATACSTSSPPCTSCSLTR